MRNLLMMKTAKTNLCIFLVLTFFAGIPQQLVGQTEKSSSDADTANLKLYLDCRDCESSYFRRNLPYVDFVRDPKTSDVHLLVTEQHTASNGRSYGLNFIGHGRYEDLKYTLFAISPQSNTDVQTWQQLMKTTRMGLMPFLSRTAEIGNLEIQYRIDTLKGVKDQSAYDNWDYWVFRLSFGSDLETEESQNEYSVSGSFDVDRITEKVKFKADVSYFRNIEQFSDNGQVIESLREEADSDAEIIFSLGPRWSVGLFNELSASSYQNIALAHSIGPAIEYNIFPWDISDMKVFSFGYHVLTNYFDYLERTVFNETEEFRISQSLRLRLILRQPWGEVETSLEGTNYFHDFSKNSLLLDSEVSVNVTKGISFYVEVNAGLIHDQLYLPAGEITLEELLLRQRQLQTTYRFSAEFGISFTFGSIYNNIVNQRL